MRFIKMVERKNEAMANRQLNYIAQANAASKNGLLKNNEKSEAQLHKRMDSNEDNTPDKGAGLRTPRKGEHNQNNDHSHTKSNKYLR